MPRTAPWRVRPLRRAPSSESYFRNAFMSECTGSHESLVTSLYSGTFCKAQPLAFSQKSCRTNRRRTAVKVYCWLSASSRLKSQEGTVMQMGGILPYKLGVYCWLGVLNIAHLWLFWIGSPSAIYRSLSRPPAGNPEKVRKTLTWPPAQGPPECLGQGLRKSFGTLSRLFSDSRGFLETCSRLSGVLGQRRVRLSFSEFSGFRASPDASGMSLNAHD